MSRLVAEFIGTSLLILLGNGVVANVVLSRTKGFNSGWIVISAGWALAVFTAVMCVSQFSGAHLNPAVSLALAIAGEFPWEQFPGYVAAQLAGGMTGAVLVYSFYHQHYLETADPDAIRATFCTSPAIRGYASNFWCELVGTYVLAIAVLFAADPQFDFGDHETIKVGMGSLGAMPVGLVVFAIGLSLGGTTGYAINPARDLGPRLIHACLPIRAKGGSDWSYGLVPILGPLAGAALAAFTKAAVVL